MTTTTTVRAARRDEARRLADWACAMAWETEHKRLDPPTVLRGVQRVFDEVHGMQLPRNSAAMARYGKKVDKDDLRPGDLVFFKRVRIDHVGIYMGDGFFIHSQSGIGVTYTKLDAPYFSTHYAGAKRVVN